MTATANLRVCRWILGVSAFLALVAWVYPTNIAFPLALIVLVSLGAVAIAPKHLGVLSWTAGIPCYYLLFLVVLPLIIQVVTRNEIEPRLEPALYIIAAGVLAFAFGVVMALRFRGLSQSYRMLGLLKIDVARSPWILKVLIVLGAGSLVWSYAFGYFGLIKIEGSEAGNAAGAVATLTFTLTIAHVMAWNAYFKTGKCLFLGLVTTALLLAFGLIANSKGQMLWPFFFMGLSLWGVKNKFPRKLVLTSALLYVFVAYPFVTASRLAIYSPNLDRWELAMMAADYLKSGEWTDTAAGANVIESLGRGLQPYFAQIVEESGHSVEYLNGRTITEAVEALVPRALNPNKPDLNMANWTGKLFGIVAPTDFETSISPTLMGEFYMNFGFIGVVVGMFFVGALAVWVDRYLIVNRDTWTMPLVLQLILWQESFVGHTILPFLKNLLLWLPLLMLLAYWSRARKRRSIEIPAASPAA